ncbi:hypothetical protein KY285_009931 [Solanum tuberosum]|nr:hypothetical protein KY285_009931 [Solanum tuberosum]
MIKKNERHVIAFSTKTQLEILDDGYKWRKYGKKKVKSNTNYLRKVEHEGDRTLPPKYITKLSSFDLTQSLTK